MKNFEPAVSGRHRPGEAPSFGIIGAGMSGLYAGLLLQSQGIDAHILESNSQRVGGRVHTHRFTNEKNQYFEAGAMRIPDIPAQRPVFDLVEYVNERVTESKRVELIPYVLYDRSGNRVYVNGRTRPDGRLMTVDYADRFPSELGFSPSATDHGRTAADLLGEVLQPFITMLAEDPVLGRERLLAYDDYSLRSFLRQVANWTPEKIDYVETMTSQSNQFYHSFVEMVIQNMDFSAEDWKTVEDGMDRLPNACADLLGRHNITMGARVDEIWNTSDNRVAVRHTASSEPQVFDKLIVAIPPSALRMMATPRWSRAKARALRAIHFQPLYKIGLRFRTRFWENLSTPIRGGQSITDLPSRWIVYPSNGIGSPGPGVLLTYSWMNDAAMWNAQSSEQRIELALRDLDILHGDEVNVREQFIEAQDVSWSSQWALGDAMFMPGQYRQHFDAARQPEGNIYFAGEHLSGHHTWILGALHSALFSCRQLLGDSDLPLLTGPTLPALQV